MPNVMVALPNIGGALCSTPQFGWRPLLESRAVTLPRRETRWNLQGCPKLAKRSQPLEGRSSPYYGMWGSFFPIVDTYLGCEDTARQSCAMVAKWRFLRPVFSASRVQHISDMHSKFALRPHHVWKYGIQSPTTEIRRGKKKKKIEITGQKYNGLPYYIGRP